MKVAVIGAGVIGTTTAWFLASKGHQVEVIDSESGPGRLTSFANGGQISVSQAEPWANPGAPFKIIKWLGSEDAPLMFRLRRDAKQWSWGVRFLLECLPNRTRKNMLDILRLGIYSRERLQALRVDEGLQYHQIEKGILQLHTNAKEFADANLRLSTLLEHGLKISVCDVSELLKIEPALKGSKIDIVGATFAADDESGDAHLFTRELEKLSKEVFCVNYNYDTEVVDIHKRGDSIDCLEMKVAGGGREEYKADAYVVAAGCASNKLMSMVGWNVPIYPVKGYSLTIPVEDPHLAPTVCITDENGKIAVSRLGDFIRVAGTAELNGYDLSLNDARCNGLLRRVKQFFPAGINYREATRWAGLRPTTPSNVPIIGKTNYSNLYLNAGHGTLGWTLACGSAAALSDIISGVRPDVDFPFL